MESLTLERPPTNHKFPTDRVVLRFENHQRALHHALWMALHEAQQLHLEALQSRLVAELADVTAWMAARDRP